LQKNSNCYTFNFKRAIFLFSLRNAGNMRIEKNLNLFIKKIKPLPKRLILPQQVHKAKIGLVKKDHLSFYPSCDALITEEKRMALTVLTADCLSIFLYDFKNEAIGLIHAGWRGSKERITYRTLKSMQDNFNTEPKNLYVVFGPAIRDCCYEVGDEFKKLFPKKYIYKRKDRLYFDLVRINRDELINFGVNKKNIFDCLLCTSCHNDILFSYRKEGKNCGRIVSLGILV